MKYRNIIGVYFGHNAGVCLMKNGVVQAFYLEERFTRVKNYTGFPTKAYEHLLADFLGGDPNHIDAVVLPTNSNTEFQFFVGDGNAFLGGKYFDYYYKTEKNQVPFWFRRAPKWFAKRHLLLDQENVKRVNSDQTISIKMKDYLVEHLMVGQEKLFFIGHHLAHAYSTCFNSEKNEKKLIFTLDASGDNICCTVNTFTENKLITLREQEKDVSIATIYREVTAFLGLKPDEHEFKVMGLAPYAKEKFARRLYEEKFKDLVSIDKNLDFTTKFPTDLMKYYLLETCVYERFDNIAAATQTLLEEKVMEWIDGWIKKTNISDISVAGGVFMNVKLNQKISAMESVEKLSIVPSASDESLPLGCCYWGHLSLNEAAPEKIKDLYLGESFSDIEYKKTAEKFSEKYDCVYYENISEKIAKLLADDNIVARFSGRSEWGARALGNRSILANASNPNVIRKLNELVKDRDFWMPFTPSILDTDFDRYIINPKNIPAYYMNITFPTTEEAKRDIIAALHPYDFTARPQKVLAEWNPEYYAILKKYKELTGMGGILNTSFNIHGEPIVCTPEDALKSFLNCGLNYLAMGNLLLSKKLK